ncbi:MAG TPA: hypothetical protein VGK67_35495 [Myxococcales bacterium]|jgi:hypothetical protein
MSTWAARANANIGCYSDGLEVAFYDGLSWTGLGEMKLDQGEEWTTGCPTSHLAGAALTVDELGSAWLAFNEGPARQSPYPGVGDIHLFRWTGEAWVRESDWAGASLDSSVALGAVANGTIWLAWSVRSESASQLLLHRSRGSGWEFFDPLDGLAKDAQGSRLPAAPEEADRNPS